MIDLTEAPNILVVDDEPPILDSIADLLEDYFSVHTATSAAAALDLLESLEVSVILSDQRMPGMQGDEFLNRARELSGATRILITAYADLQALVRAVNKGQIYAYVAKPWDPWELQVKVQQAASHYQLTREREQRARELHFLHTVEELVTKSDTVEGALEATARELGEVVGAVGAEAWMAGGPDGELRMVAAWYRRDGGAGPFVERGRSMRFSPGEGVPGRVWNAAEAEILGDGLAEPGLGRVDLARECGIRSCIGLPVLAEGKPVACYLLLGEDTLEEDQTAQVSLVRTVAGQLGNAILRKKAEVELQRSEARFRSFVESISDTIVVLSEGGVIEYASPSAREAVGKEPQDLVGVELLDHVHPEDRTRVRDLLSSAQARRESVLPQELRVRHTEGAWRTMEMSVASLRTTSPFEGLIAVLRDVTAEKLMEDQLRQAQRLESLGRFAGGIAHDFNNLLAAVLGNSELLLDTAPEGEMAEVLEDIRGAAELGRGLTHKLLAFGRRQTTSPEVLCLDQVVEEVERTFLRMLGADIALETKLDTLEVRIHMDPTQLEQVIMNLVLNARDAMPNGGRLVIETREVTRDGGTQHVLLQVRDTGTGMDRDVLNHIFEPFFTTKEEGKGTGLGLATVFGIVAQSGGHIEVDSDPGEGTVFRIYLPRYEGLDALRAETPKERGPLEKGSATVLVVDDEPTVARSICRILKRAGYAVLNAQGPVDALNLVQARGADIDLVLTDVSMPGMNGVQLVERIRATQPGLPAVFLSGYDRDNLGEGIERESLSPGVPFLQKPFTANELIRVAEQALRAAAD